MDELTKQLLKARDEHLQQTAAIEFVKQRITDFEKRNPLSVSRRNELRFLRQLRDKMLAETAPPTPPVRTVAAIDAECQASARVYIAASKHGGLAESTLLALFARVATLMWVLSPSMTEVQAQGAAWELIARLREDGGE